MENNWSGKNVLVIIYGYGTIPNEKRKERYVSASGLRRCTHDDNEGLMAEVCRRRLVKPSKTSTDGNPQWFQMQWRRIAAVSVCEYIIDAQFNR